MAYTFCGWTAEIQEKDWRLRQRKLEARRRDDKIDTYTFLKEEAELDFLKESRLGQCDRIRELGGELRGHPRGLPGHHRRAGGAAPAGGRAEP